MKKYLNERGFRIVEALHTVAKELNSTPARIALAWLIARPSVCAPIASATSVEQLTDLIEATKVSLDQTHIKFMNEASAYETVVSK